jgi:membrane glycosyltransferase
MKFGLFYNAIRLLENSFSFNSLVTQQSLKEMSLLMLTEHVYPALLVGILQQVRDAKQEALNAKAEVGELDTKFTSLGADVATLKHEHKKDLQNAYKQTKEKVDKGLTRKQVSLAKSSESTTKIQQLDGETHPTLQGLT